MVFFFLSFWRITRQQKSLQLTWKHKGKHFGSLEILKIIQLNLTEIYVNIAFMNTFKTNCNGWTVLENKYLVQNRYKILTEMINNYVWQLFINIIWQRYSYCTEVSKRSISMYEKRSFVSLLKKSPHPIPKP